MPRLPRFKRISSVAPIQLTERDVNIIRLLHRHRFLSSGQIIALIGSSSQQMLRRLKLLYHHGFLDRPRAQLAYYTYEGNRPLVYGLSTKSRTLLEHGLGDAELSSEQNCDVGAIFLEHALLVSDVMVSLELACRRHGNVRLLHKDELGLPGGEKLFRWQVKIRDGIKLGVIPDCVFALEYTDQAGIAQRTYFFLEADRGTMPVIRKGLAQTSFYRKLLAYEATWTQKVHQRLLGIPRFRVLTVTTNPSRVDSLVAACSQLKRGHGLFLFADRSVLAGNPLLAVWRTTKTSAFSQPYGFSELA